MSAETWVDLHWPCFTATDEDQDCLLEDVRGHGLVRKLSKVKRAQIDFVRLGRYPSGVLTVNNTNVNSGTRPLIESRTAWVPAEQFCGDSSLRTWNRVTFDVRWSDDYLTKGLTLLSDPTGDYPTVICPTSARPWSSGGPSATSCWGNCGKDGIRTHGRLATSTVFETHVARPGLSPAVTSPPGQGRVQRIRRF